MGNTGPFGGSVVHILILTASWDGHRSVSEWKNGRKHYDENHNEPTKETGNDYSIPVNSVDSH